MTKDYFRLEGNPQLNKESFTFSESSKYPYFTRTVFNNGIFGYADYLDDAHLIKGNSLAVGMMACKFFYMSHDFYAGQFTKTAFPLFEGFNEQVALWFTTWFNKSSKKYLGVLVRNFEEEFYNTTLILPFNKDGKLAFKYIEERMRELEEERMRELEAYLAAAGFANCDLTPEEQVALRKFSNGEVKFTSYRIGDHFKKLALGKHKFNKRTDVSKIPTKEHTIPLVNAKHGDNGIMFYGKPDLFEGVDMTIDIVQNGAVATGDVYAQPQTTSVLWDAYLIKRQNGSDNESTLLYSTVSIGKSIKLKYGYDNKATWERVQNDSMILPTTPNGEIDYDFMGTYISAIKKQIIARLKAEIAREHKAYESVIND